MYRERYRKRLQRKDGEAHGIILAPPTYFTDVSAEMKALIDRAGYVARANDNMLRRRAGAVVVAFRRARGIHAFDTLKYFFYINETVVPGSSSGNIGVGLAAGDVKRDDEGPDTMRTPGRNIT